MNHSFIRGVNRKKGSGRAEALILISALHFGRLLRPRRGATPQACHSFIVPSHAATHRSSLGVARDSPNALLCVCVCVWIKRGL